jgi:hypothetical protein
MAHTEKEVEQSTEILAKILSENPSLRKQFAEKLNLTSKGHPYYTEESALKVKILADKMMQDHQDVVLPAENFPGYRLNSVKEKLYKGLQYLCDNLDTKELKYRVFQASVQISIVKNKYIVIRFKGVNRIGGEIDFLSAATPANEYFKDKREAKMLDETEEAKAATTVEEGVTAFYLRSNMDTILNEMQRGERRKYYCDFTQQDIEWFYNLMENNFEFTYDIDNERLIVARVPRERSEA